MTANTSILGDQPDPVKNATQLTPFEALAFVEYCIQRFCQHILAEAGETGLVSEKHLRQFAFDIAGKLEAESDIEGLHELAYAILDQHISSSMVAKSAPAPINDITQFKIYQRKDN